VEKGRGPRAYPFFYCQALPVLIIREEIFPFGKTSIQAKILSLRARATSICAGIYKCKKGEARAPIPFFIAKPCPFLLFGRKYFPLGRVPYNGKYRCRSFEKLFWCAGNIAEVLKNYFGASATLPNV
jgi:hypothetical protein